MVVSGAGVARGSVAGVWLGLACCVVMAITMARGGPEAIGLEERARLA